MSLPFLLGSEVDWVDELIGASFKVKNPNATSSCGCGVSFSVWMFGGRSKLDKGLDAFERANGSGRASLLEEALQDEPRPAGFYHLGLHVLARARRRRRQAAAVDCFERGAEFGHPGAQTAYGIALRSGVGVAKNNEAALHAVSLGRWRR